MFQLSATTTVTAATNSVLSAKLQNSALRTSVQTQVNLGQLRSSCIQVMIQQRSQRRHFKDYFIFTMYIRIFTTLFSTARLLFSSFSLPVCFKKNFQINFGAFWLKLNLHIFFKINKSIFTEMIDYDYMYSFIFLDTFSHATQTVLIPLSISK